MKGSHTSFGVITTLLFCNDTLQERRCLPKSTAEVAFIGRLVELMLAREVSLLVTENAIARLAFSATRHAVVNFMFLI